mgnify:CR=1 FL=1
MQKLFGVLVVVMPTLASATQAETVLLAVNVGGEAVSYDGIDFAAGNGSGTGNIGIEQPGNAGLNGLQEALVGTPFASMRWEREVLFSHPVPQGPVSVDLYFMEGWHAEPGKRLMTIEVEGEVVRADYDVLTEADGDMNAPQILRITDVDAARSGDPERLDIRLTSNVDNAVLSAVVVRCQQDADLCGTQLAAAEAAKAEAAASAPRLVDADTPLDTIIGEPIAIEFAGLREGKRYWITLVPDGTPDGEWADYEYVAGSGAQTVTFEPTEMDGGYEFRLHLDGNGDPLLARRSVRVVSAFEAANPGVDPTIGYFQTLNNLTVRGGIIAGNVRLLSEFVSTGEDAVLTLNSASGFSCEALFTAAPVPTDMTLLHHTCGQTFGDFEILGITNDVLQIQLSVENTPGYVFGLARQNVDLNGTGHRLPEGRAIDILGIDYTRSSSALRAAIEGVLSPDDGNAWNVLAETPFTRVEVITGARPGRDGKETFAMLTIRRGDDPQVLAFARLSQPGEEARPTVAVLSDALLEKYGPATGRWAERAEHFAGYTWVYGADGAQREGGESWRCVQWPFGGELVVEAQPPLRQAFGFRMGAPAPIVDIPVRRECGLTIVVRHPETPDPLAQPAWTFTLISDASAWYDDEWTILSDRTKKRAAALGEAQSIAEAEAEEAQGITPDL